MFAWDEQENIFREELRKMILMYSNSDFYDTVYLGQHYLISICLAENQCLETAETNVG